MEVVVGNGYSLHAETDGVPLDSVAEGWKAQAAGALDPGYCRRRASSQIQVGPRASERFHSAPGWYEGGESVSEGHAPMAGECLTWDEGSMKRQAGMCQGPFHRVRRQPSTGRILLLLSIYPRSSRCPCDGKWDAFPDQTSHANSRLQGFEKRPYQACQRRSGRPPNWLTGGGRLVLGCSPPFPTARCNIGGECYL